MSVLGQINIFFFFYYYRHLILPVPGPSDLSRRPFPSVPHRRRPRRLEQAAGHRLEGGHVTRRVRPRVVSRHRHETRPPDLRRRTVQLRDGLQRYYRTSIYCHLTSKVTSPHPFNYFPQCKELDLQSRLYGHLFNKDTFDIMELSRNHRLFC